METGDRTVESPLGDDDFTVTADYVLELFTSAAAVADMERLARAVYSAGARHQDVRDIAAVTSSLVTFQT